MVRVRSATADLPDQRRPKPGERLIAPEEIIVFGDVAADWPAKANLSDETMPIVDH